MALAEGFQANGVILCCVTGLLERGIMDCIFCKIIAGQIPSFTLYENEIVICFLDVFPANPGHTLIVPKAHYKNVAETPEQVLQGIISAAKYLSPIVVKAVGMEGFNLFLNDGRSAGQLVEHVHLHVLPRQQGDNLRVHPPQKSYPQGEAEKIQAKIRGLLTAK